MRVRVRRARLDDERRELGDQRGTARCRERRGDADELELARVVVQAEQERAEQRLRGGRRLVQAVPREHDVRLAAVLDLEHRPLVRLVRAVERLGDDAVQPSPSNVSNHSRATATSRVRGVACTAGPSRPSESSTSCRRASGARVRSSSPSASTSNTTSAAGSAPRAAARATQPGGCVAGAPRTSRRPSRATTISPSTTHRGGSAARTASTTSGSSGPWAARSCCRAAPRRRRGTRSRGSRPTSARTRTRRRRRRARARWARTSRAWAAREA